LPEKAVTEVLLSHPGCLGNVLHGGAGGNITTCRVSIEFLDDRLFHSLDKESPLVKKKA
jgi:hypothetical protein